MFKLSRSVGTPVPPFEYLPATSAETISMGEVLVLDDGLLTKCGADVSPTFIAVADAVGDGTSLVPVMRINGTIELETAFSADGGSLDIGDKVTIASDGLRVTATTTDGVFEISRIDGDGDVGSVVAGFFPNVVYIEVESEA